MKLRAARGSSSLRLEGMAGGKTGLARSTGESDPINLQTSGTLPLPPFQAMENSLRAQQEAGVGADAPRGLRQRLVIVVGKRAAEKLRGWLVFVPFDIKAMPFRYQVKILSRARADHV